MNAGTVLGGVPLAIQILSGCMEGQERQTFTETPLIQSVKGME